jgi:hypothetical protein
VPPVVDAPLKGDAIEDASGLAKNGEAATRTAAVRRREA